MSRRSATVPAGLFMIALLLGAFAVAAKVGTSGSCPSPSPSPSSSSSGSPSETGTPTPTASDTGTPTPTSSDTGTPTPTSSDTGTPTPSDSGSATPSTMDTINALVNTVKSLIAKPIVTITGVATIPPQSGSPSPSDTPTSAAPELRPARAPEASDSPTPSGGCAKAELSIGITPHTAVYGTRFTISGALKCDDVPLAGEVVTVTRPGASAGDVGSSAAVKTDAQGRYNATDKPSKTSEYTATWDGNATCAAAGSDIARAEVRPGVIANIDDPVVDGGTFVTFTGRVLPAHPGLTVILQLLQGSSGKWAEAASDTLDERSNYSMRYRKTSAGYLLFRVKFPTQDDDHVWNVSRRIRADWR